MKKILSKKRKAQTVPLDLEGALFKRLREYAQDVNIAIEDAAKVMLRQGLDEYYEAE